MFGILVIASMFKIDGVQGLAPVFVARGDCFVSALRFSRGGYRNVEFLTCSFFLSEIKFAQTGLLNSAIQFFSYFLIDRTFVLWYFIREVKLT